MYSQSSSKHKSKPKMNPMDMDFGFMIKNHPEFFTKLSSRDHVPERPSSFSKLLPVPGGYPARAPSVPDGYLTGRSSKGGGGRRVGGLDATLKPKIYPPTLMRNAKPKKGRNNFFK
jgi:hypothetical protein